MDIVNKAFKLINILIILRFLNFSNWYDLSKIQQNN